MNSSQESQRVEKPFEATRPDETFNRGSRTEGRNAKRKSETTNWVAPESHKTPAVLRSGRQQLLAVYPADTYIDYEDLEGMYEYEGR